jgi:periplasmic divalent cation tolerance protein
MTKDFIEIHWASGNLDEARRISRYLVQERYVAAAQITPWIESTFMWNNQLETVQESKIVFIARTDQYEEISRIIKKNTTYEVPQITYIYIDGGNQEYMQWLTEAMPSKQATEYTVR